MLFFPLRLLSRSTELGWNVFALKWLLCGGAMDFWRSTSIDDHLPFDVLRPIRLLDLFAPNLVGRKHIGTRPLCLRTTSLDLASLVSLPFKESTNYHTRDKEL